MGIHLHCLVCTTLNATVVMLRQWFFSNGNPMSGMLISSCTRGLGSLWRNYYAQYTVQALKKMVFSVEEHVLGGVLPNNRIISNNPEQFQPLMWMSCISKICDMEVCETVQANRKSDTYWNGLSLLFRDWNILKRLWPLMFIGFVTTRFLFPWG